MKKELFAMSEKQLDFETLYNELSQKYSDTLAELETYQLKVVPKFNVGQTIYAVHPDNEEPIELKIDSIEISKFGVSYTEYVDETTIKHMPELFCFDNLNEAKEKMGEIKNLKLGM